MRLGRFTTHAAAAGVLLTLAQAQVRAADEVAETQPPAPATAPWSLSEATGLNKLTDPLNIKVYGWVEQSYTYNFNSPHDRVNGARGFDDRSNDYRFNQLALNVERPLPDGKDFAIGGKVELMYGSDARFLHAAGLSDNQTDTVQFDPLQFYGLVRLPVGNGLTVKFGRYATSLGAEVIDAPGNALYSHGFLFNYAIPLTHVGVQLDYPINDNLSVYYGVVEGWNVFNDNNSSVSHMAGLYGKSTDKKLSYFLNVVTGPERNFENTDYRTVVDLVASYALTDQLSATFNADYGNESGAPSFSRVGNNWYGVAGYLTYTLNPQIATTLRAEYIRDETGSRLGIPDGPTNAIGLPVEAFEVTWGLDVHPLQNFTNLRVRPEIRWDHSMTSVGFDDLANRDQVTLAADVIITF